MKRGRHAGQEKVDGVVGGPGWRCGREGDAKPAATHEPESATSLLRVHEWGLNPVFWVGFSSRLCCVLMEWGQRSGC